MPSRTQPAAATEAAEPGEPRVGASQAWRLCGSVALRPEPFGALVYDFATRALSFLKTPALVRVVEGLGDHERVSDALADAAVPPDQWPAYLAALDTLARTGIIEERAA